MLTAEMVRATKRAGALHVKGLTGKDRERAEELAEMFLGIVKDAEGSSREELTTAWAEVPSVAREKKLVEGLLKLIDDACEFASVGELDPRVLRGEVFLLAAQARQADTFDRQQVLDAVASAHGLVSLQLERALFSDLRAAQVLTHAPALTAATLVAQYDDAQVQAVLLRATRVTARLRCDSAAAYRALFHKLKFRRLLVEIHPEADGGYRLEIDGPFSLFDSVTKYGLQLALSLPALQQAERLSLTAELRWGKSREPLTFSYEYKRASGRQQAPGAPRREESGGEKEPVDRAEPADSVELGEDAARLLEAFTALSSGWKVQPATEVVDIPGVGLCVPDLLFTARDGRRVLLEVMGYWSREAVWKRVELAQSGKLGKRVIFAVSSRLRVSEAVLEEEHAALYVFKGVMSARAVLEHLEAVSPPGRAG